MRIDRTALEHALLVHGSLDWDEQDIGIFAGEIMDCCGDHPVPSMMAHILWTMGACKDHDGCRYGPPDENNADSSNLCEECEIYLTEIAERIISDLAENRHDSVAHLPKEKN